MSYPPSSSSTCTINDTPRSNLVRQVLKQGQRLRAAMVQTILNQEVMPANVLYNAYNTEIVPTLIGLPTHVINNPVMPINNITHANRTKFLSYLRGDQMSFAEEKDVLHIFRSMSNSDIYELTVHAKQSDNVCECDTCKTYQNTIEKDELNCDNNQWSHKNSESPTSARICNCKHNLEASPNLACLKYADSLKVAIHSILLNKEGKQKINSHSGKLNTTYFVEYKIPRDLVKLPTKSRTKVDTGLDTNPIIRMCSKHIIENAVCFNQIFLHNDCKVNDVDLCKLDLRFRICSRVPNQKGINVLGFANFNMASFHGSKNLTCSQELPIILKENMPIVLGVFRVSLQLGYGNIYYGQQFIDAVNNPQQTSILNDKFSLAEEGFNNLLEFQDYQNMKRDQCKSKMKNVFPPVVENFELPPLVCKNPKLMKNTSKKNITTKCDSKQSKEFVEDDSKMSMCVIPHKTAQNTSNQQRILFGFIYVSQAQYLGNIPSSFLSYRPFGYEDLIVSKVTFGTSNHVFNFHQRIPYVYGDVLLNNLRDNFMIVEYWEQIDSNKKLIGHSTISLHQFYLAFRNPDIVTYLYRNKSPVIGTDWWESITDADTKEIRGHAQILIALGSQIQIDTLLIERGFTESIVKILKCDALKSQTRNIAVTYVKNNSLKIDVGVQSEPYNMNDEIKGIENNTQSAHVMLGILPQLTDQTSINNLNDVTSNEIGHCVIYDAVPTIDSTVQQNANSTVELRNSNQIAFNDPSYVSNLNPQSLNNTFNAHVVIKKALHLPTRRKCKSKKNIRDKCSKIIDEVLKPSTYVTFEARPNGIPFVTQIIQKSDSPEWNWKADVKFPIYLLINNQKRIIFKVWKKNNNAYLQPNMELDTIVGFASLDLTVLLAGLPTIEGWFNVVDLSSKCRGQINIIIKPLESLSKFSKSTSTVVCKNTSYQPMPNSCDELIGLCQEPDELLNRALKRKFIELDEITQRLRSRLSDVVGESEIVDVDINLSNDAFEEQFDRDINTLCIEGDYGNVDFMQEAKLVQLQQVSLALREIQSKEIEINERVLSITTNSNDNNCSFSISMEEGTQDTSTSSLNTDDVKHVDLPTSTLLLKDLDNELAQGKQRIDSLLNKLTLISNSDANQNVPGCSVWDLEESNPSIDETDIIVVSSQDMDVAESHVHMTTTPDKSGNIF